MKKLALLAVALGIVGFGVLLPAPASAAWKPFGGVKCQGNVNNSAVCQDAGSQTSQNPLTGTDGLLTKVTNIVAVITGVTAVFVIFLAGLKLIQSGGSSDEVAAARHAIIYAAVGLIVIILARTLILFVIGGL